MEILFSGEERAVSGEERAVSYCKCGCASSLNLSHHDLLMMFQELLTKFLGYIPEAIHWTDLTLKKVIK